MQFTRNLNPGHRDEFLLTRRVDHLILGALDVRDMTLICFVRKWGIRDGALHRFNRLVPHLGCPLGGLIRWEFVEKQRSRIRYGK
jgi:hypothetical protein